MSYKPGVWHRFRVEGDLSQPIGRYNPYVDDGLVADFVPIERASLERVAYNKGFSTLGQVNTLALMTDKLPADAHVDVDSIVAVGHALTGRPNYPIASETVLDEPFETKPDIAGWNQKNYDEQAWKTAQLPYPHGSERFAEEDLYLRKTLFVPTGFEQAFLNIETLDPGGEVWVNGQPVAKINNRYPIRLDVSRYLTPGDSNLIALKVNHFYLTEAVGELMTHSLLDFSIGWFAGRASLDLVNAAHVRAAFAHMLPLTGSAAVATAAVVTVKTKIELRHTGAFAGQVEVRAFPWLPTASEKAVATVSMPVNFRDSVDMFPLLTMKNPALWTPDNPALYKFQITLRDERGKTVDDYVLTTGLRTVDQQGGHFRLNGQVTMLNGA